PVVSGPTHRLVVVTPSQAVVGQASWALVRAEDAWGNPTGADDIEVAGQRHALVEGAYRFENVVHTAPGLTMLSVGSAESNPIEVVPAPTELTPFWADLHGQSEETIGTNTVEDYFRFARDKAGVDLSCHQGNDFQVTPAIWDEIKRQTKAFHQPG